MCWRTLCATALVFSAIAVLSDARALPPTPAPQVELFVSGSTAQDEALENLLRLSGGVSGAPNICEPGTLDIYRGTLNGTANRVFYCRTSQVVSGLPAGLRLAIYKSSGGSGEGVTPVSAATPLRFIDLGKLSPAPSCTLGEPARATPDFAAYRNHTACDGEGRPAVPRAGLSDVNPELVGGMSAPLTVRAQNQIVWGLPVSKNFRNALQTIQGLVPSAVPHDDPSRDTEEAMPTLARAQVAAIFAGAIKSWNEFYDSKGTPLPQSSFLGLGPPRDPDASGASPGAYRPDRHRVDDLRLPPHSILRNPGRLRGALSALALRDERARLRETQRRQRSDRGRGRQPPGAGHAANGQRVCRNRQR